MPGAWSRALSCAAAIVLLVGWVQPTSFTGFTVGCTHPTDRAGRALTRSATGAALAGRLLPLDPRTACGIEWTWHATILSSVASPGTRMTLRGRLRGSSVARIEPIELERASGASREALEQVVKAHGRATNMKRTLALAGGASVAHDVVRPSRRGCRVPRRASDPALFTRRFFGHGLPRLLDVLSASAGRAGG